MKHGWIVIVVAGIGVLIQLVAGPAITLGPAPWLDSWMKWIGVVVVVAAGV